MRGRLALAGLLAGLLAASTSEAVRGLPRIHQVDCTTTRAHIVASTSARTALTVQNVGTINVYLGAGEPGVLSTTANQFTLHAGAAIEFGGVRGGDPTVYLECIADGSVRLQIIEEF